MIPTGADETPSARQEQPPHVELIERLHFAARPDDEFRRLESKARDMRV